MSVDLEQYGAEVTEAFRLPWAIEIRPYEDGTYFARVPELPGCMTEADSRAEALDQLDEALAEWLTVALERDMHIPTPRFIDDYSGKIFVRTSSALHARVAECAASMNVSMSQWIGEVLARETTLQEARDDLAIMANEIARLARGFEMISEARSKAPIVVSFEQIRGEEMLARYRTVADQRIGRVTEMSKYKAQKRSAAQLKAS